MKCGQSNRSNGYACRVDKNPYRHDRRADKNPYRHDRHADKNPYRRAKASVKKLSQDFFAKSPFFNLDLQKRRIFLKTHTNRLMFHYQLFYSVQLAFLVLGSIFDGGVFQKILYFVI